jgi:hypothetical protein
MDHLSAIFATVVTVLAAIAVIGALVFAVIWEVCAIRRTLAAYRAAVGRPPTDEDFWRHQRALAGPK